MWAAAGTQDSGGIFGLTQPPFRRGQRRDVRRLGPVPQGQHQPEHDLGLGSRAQGEVIDAAAY